ncbi:LacI family DNA-binding transcriptional regulator [Bifidobacterium simiarum]|uniref:LacI family DNA-binding transcriptional regulator n=1 Tax=Bifidobacterium simiarum TaxID=2045441 RepID=UPI001BDC570D|nr:substrate-binding domain-containing protein [Bifidobacterium simiarum]MBT1167070.1 substrate-binding domain-containing protein [Bifidobacterium simiarum]
MDIVEQTAAASQTAKTKLTVADIAAIAKVSAPTVSKVINGRPGVSDATRERILTILREHHYISPVAPSSHKTGIIELLISHPHTAWADEILVGTLEGLEGSGYTPAVSSCPPVEWSFDPWIDEAVRHGASGAMICLTNIPAAGIERLRRAGIKVILVDPTGVVPQDVSMIGSSDYQGANDATRHLVQLGHRRIAFLKGPDDWRTCRARFNGYRSMMEEAGLPIDPDLVLGEVYYYDDGYECGRRLFAMDDPPTAVFASSDMQAAGLYQAAQEAGLAIPDDVSIVGFDDLPYVRFLSPQLTTVHHAIQDMARLGARSLVDMINGEEALTRIDLLTHLEVRGSTAPPKRR